MAAMQPQRWGNRIYHAEGICPCQFPDEEFFILNTPDAITILRSYDTLPAALLPAGFLLAFHDAYGARNVATGRIRRFVEAFEYRAWKDAELTPGHEAVYDFRAVWARDVQRLADKLSYEPVTKRYGYYANRKWYMQPDAIMQRLQHEGEAWVTSRKVRDAVMLRKAGA